MKKVLSAFVLVAAATSAQASSSNVQIIAKNASVETNLCVIAAQKGIEAATAYAVKNDVKARSFESTQCNGENIKSFADAFKADETTANKAIEVVPGNQSLESQLCLKAVNEGVRAVGHKSNSLKCNGLSVESFVKAVKNS
ncbi:hypothetical protein ACFSJY_02605 [Thalassotalea euphylliae]|uniref:hypothetical protein n=1 Tax=Thalassotalea euphylliae TaxID=1655234 RepID=UPI0036422F4E